MKKLSIIALIYFIAITNCLAYNKNVKLLGDFGSFAIPLSAFLITLHKEDQEGSFEMLEGAFWTLTATHGTKYFVDAERPNGKDFNSFPSGHTSATFQGASFLHFRYGFKFSIPFYLASSFVAYSRVYSNYHYPKDVLAGALLAIGIQYVVSNTDFNLTSYYITPYFENKTTGVTLGFRF